MYFCKMCTFVKGVPLLNVYVNLLKYVSIPCYLLCALLYIPTYLVEDELGFCEVIP